MRTLVIGFRVLASLVWPHFNALRLQISYFQKGHTLRWTHILGGTIQSTISGHNTGNGVGTMLCEQRE